MATIEFRARVRHVLNIDRTLAFRYVRVPVLQRLHCDMTAFRNHPKFGGFANSDLFPNVLSRIRADLGERIRLDKIPANVKIDESGFLALITIEV